MYVCISDVPIFCRPGRGGGDVPKFTNKEGWLLFLKELRRLLISSRCLNLPSAGPEKRSEISLEQ